MRYKFAVALVSITLLFVLLGPSATHGQFKSKGGFSGGFGPGGFTPGGGSPGGSFGGPRDPNMMFDFLARGRGYFLVTDTNRLREPLTQFLQEKGITNGQVTRELFTSYNEKVQTSMGGSPGGFPGRGMMAPSGGPSPSPFGMRDQGGNNPFAMSQPGGNPLETLNQLGETEFKIRDRNGDGFLNQDEMPDQLKSELSKWDTSRDNLVSTDEFKVYYVARMQSRRGPGGQSINPVTIILDDEELETRPVVYRASKLPTKELPGWFMELDNDKDGQVGLYEWRKGGKDMDEFLDWDRNNDGLVTPEEALYKQRINQVASAANGDESEEGSSKPRSNKGPAGMFNGGSRGENGGGDRSKGKGGWGEKGNGASSGFKFKRPQ